MARRRINRRSLKGGRRLRDPGETELGGERRDFPATSWSLVNGLQSTTPENRRMAFDSLSRRYWKPVYNYVRHARCKMSDEAKDLTQGFFAWLFEAEPLSRYSAEKARFRGFLKHILRGFLSDQTDYNEAAKRGGRMKVVSVDQIPNLESYLADNRGAKPEEVFDWAWRKELLDHAIERVREWFASTRRTKQFRAFEEHDLTLDQDRPTMAQVAEKLGVTEGHVRNYLHTVREEIRQEIRSEIAQTVSSLDSLEEEWNELFGR